MKPTRCTHPPGAMALLLVLALAGVVRAQSTTPADFLATYRKALELPAEAKTNWDAFAKQHPKEELGHVARLMVVIHLLLEKDVAGAAAAFPAELPYAIVPPPDPTSTEMRKDLVISAKSIQARIRMLQIAEKLQAFYAKRVEYPASLNELVGLKMVAPGDLVDPFGESYAYETKPNTLAPDVPRQRYTLSCTSLKMERRQALDALKRLGEPIKQITLSSLDAKTGEAYLKVIRADGSASPTNRVPLGQEIEDLTPWGVYENFMVVGWQKLPRILVKE